MLLLEVESGAEPHRAFAATSLVDTLAFQLKHQSIPVFRSLTREREESAQAASLVNEFRVFLLKLAKSTL